MKMISLKSGLNRVLNATTRIARRSLVTCAFVALATLLLALPPSARAQTTFDITSDSRYAEFKDALTASQIVLLENSLAPNPRLLAVLAAASELARLNPSASTDQLEQFAITFNTALATSFADDPDLNRRGNFIAAVRFVARVTPTTEVLAGLDLNIGESTLEALGLDLGSASYRQRSVQHQRSQVVDVAQNAVTTRTLVAAFMDARVSPAIAAFLRSQNIEPFPTPAVLASAFPEIAGARVTMPATYADYLTARSANFADAKALSLAELATVRGAIDTHLQSVAAELAADGDTGMWARYTPTPDPALMAQLAQRLQDEARARAVSRARLTMNNFLQAQALDPGVHIGANQLEDLAAITLQTEETTGRVSAGLNIAGGIIGAGVAFAAEGPGAIVGGVGLLLGVASAITDLVGDETGPPPPEQQIFDQINQLRQQVEQVRLEMHARFDAIDRQLEVIYATMSDSFNLINETLRRVEGSLSEIQVSLYGVRSAINRLEANLYGVLADGFQQDLLIDMDFGLGHRARTGFDLAYSGAGNSTYTGLESTFYTWATTIAADSGHAGPTSPNLTYGPTAIDQLADFPLGFNINNLRAFPTQLGLSSLSSQRLVDPTTWSFVADAYAQLGRENPWYFAAINATSPQRLNDIIAKGETARDAMRNAKSAALYNRLLDDFDARVPAMADLLAQRHTANVATLFPELAPLNVWLDETQPIVQFTSPPVGLLSSTWATVYDPSGGSSQYQLRPPGGARYWGLIHPAIGIATKLRLNVPDLLHPTVTTLAGSGFTHSCQVSVNPVDTSQTQFDLHYTYSTSWRGQLVAIVRNVVRIYHSDGCIQCAEYYALDAWNGQIAQTWFDPPGTTYNYTGGARVLSKISGSVDYRGHIDDIIAAAHDALATRRTTAAGVLYAGLDQAGALRDAIDAAQVPVSMLDAYLSLGAPESFVSSDILRAGIRGGGANGGYGGLGDGTLRELILADSNVNFASSADIQAAMRQRSDALRAEVDAMLESAPPESHDYMTWSIAGLRDLRTLPTRLTVPDRYAVTPNQSLVVPAASGLLTNDAVQGQDISRAATIMTFPTHGSVTLHPDGSFEYTPTPGFTGLDTFAYRASATITVPGQSSIVVNANTASVYLLVGQSVPTCVADVDDGSATGARDGAVTIDDLLYYLTIFQAGHIDADLDDGTATATPDQAVTIDDLLYYIERFQLGC